MSEVIANERSHRTEVISQDGKLFVHTIFNEKAALEQNKLIRNHGFMKNGELGLHDKADIRFGISCPSNLQWELFKKTYPDIYKSIKSTDESERVKGCKQLQLIEPEWVVQERL